MTDQPVVTARQDALEQNVLLLAPSIGWWKGTYQLPRTKTDIKVDDKAVSNNDVTTPRAKLIGDTYPHDADGRLWKKRFQKLDSRLEAVKGRYSVKFPIAGVRVVPKSKGAELMYELFGDTIGTLEHRSEQCRGQGRHSEADVIDNRVAERVNAVQTKHGGVVSKSTPVFDPNRTVQSIAYDLDMVAEEFCDHLPHVLAEIARENDVYAQVASRVPQSAGLMRSKFHLDVVPIELAGTTKTNKLTATDLEDHNEIVRDACQRQVEAAVEEMIAGPRQQLAEALANLKGLIDRNGRVRSTSFAPVRQAIEKIRMFEFCANDDLLESMRLLEHRLNITTPKNLDATTSANSGFTAAIEGFMSEVQDADQHQRDLDSFGKDLRSIDID
jgi:hypothetical protein